MRNIYSLSEIINNSVSLVYTKIFYKKARLVRRPIFVRGKKYLDYGEGMTTGYNCRLEMFNVSSGNKKKLTLGKNCKMGDYVHIAAGENVTLGDNCLLASKIYISDMNHGDYSGGLASSSPDTPPDQRALSTKPVKVGNNVWIGESVSILPGVTIGDGVIIGANSLVNKDIPPNCIAVGSPAKVIKIYNEKNKSWEKIKY